jgi:hypothetical protein
LSRFQEKKLRVFFWARFFKHRNIFLRLKQHIWDIIHISSINIMYKMLFKYFFDIFLVQNTRVLIVFLKYIKIDFSSNETLCIDTNIG